LNLLSIVIWPGEELGGAVELVGARLRNRYREQGSQQGGYGNRQKRRARGVEMPGSLATAHRVL